MQCSSVHRRAVSRKSAHSAAPTLRSNATTSRWLLSMAHLRGVLSYIVKTLNPNPTRLILANMLASVPRLVLAFTSASAEISSWQAAVWPFSAARCRAVRCCQLEQKIRRKYRGKKTQQKFSNKFWTWMLTKLSHSRQLRLKSAAGKLSCHHFRQRHAERCVGL